MASTVLDEISPQHRSPVVLVSATRSGSTLLQRVLNVHPDLTIWGEHYGLLAPLMNSVRKVRAAAKAIDKGHSYKRQLLSGDPRATAKLSNPHISPFGAEEYIDRLRRLVLDLFTSDLAPEISWGFKEVRYGFNDLRTFCRLFPDTQVLVLARDPHDQLSSMVRAPWRDHHDPTTQEGLEKLESALGNMAQGWTTKYRSLRKFAEDEPAKVLRVRYADLRPDAFDAHAVFGHLGLAAPPAADIARVFDRRVGSSDDGKWSASDRAAIERILSEFVWPDGHDDLVDFFLADTQSST